MADPVYDYDYDQKGNLRPSGSAEVRKWTYKDYKNWELKPGERYELINGVAYPMFTPNAMAAPNTEHQLIVSILNAEFYNFLKGRKCKVIPAPYDVRLFYKKDESDDTVVQPDLIVVCDQKKLGKEGCRGAPDLAIEILSPSNTAIEMRRKLNIYKEAGVLEIWIIDPEEKQVDVNLLQSGRYVLSEFKNGDSLRSENFPGFEIPLNDLFADG